MCVALERCVMCFHMLVAQVLVYETVQQPIRVGSKYTSVTVLEVMVIRGGLG